MPNYFQQTTSVCTCTTKTAIICESNILTEEIRLISQNFRFMQIPLTTFNRFILPWKSIPERNIS